MATAPAPTTPRLRSLDVFRGLTIAAMLVVNNPGTWSHIYPPLRHAPWHGCTPTDLIFPFFLFIVGVAMAFSSRLNPAAAAKPAILKSVLVRALILIALGLLLNLASTLTRSPIDFTFFRYPGVLQRIGLCYFFTACILLFLPLRAQVALAVAILVGYWLLLTSLPLDVSPGARLDISSNIVARVDHFLLGPTHLYRGNTPTPHDPEGLLSTLPAIVTTLLGVWTGRKLKDQLKTPASTPAALLPLASAGLVALALGWYLDRTLIPLNKELWTSSYVLYTAGCALLALVLCLVLVDILPQSNPTSRLRRLPRTLLFPFESLGLNAILAFVGSGLLARLLAFIKVPTTDPANPSAPIPLSRFLYESIFQTPAHPELGSLLYALAHLALWTILVYVLYRRRWFWKI